MHIIRVLFQNQTLYKTCKIGKKGCISVHVNKIWKGHDKPIKQNSNKNLYLQTLHLKKTKNKKKKTKKQNKTKQNKQTLLQGYHHFHWNREEHEFPKLSPPQLQYWRCTENMHFQNYFIAQHYHTYFSPSKNLPIPYEKIPYPQFHHPPLKKKKNLPKPLYLVPIYSLSSHLHTKVKVIYVLLALLPTTLHNMRRKKKKTLSFTLTTPLFVV